MQLRVRLQTPPILSPGSEAGKTAWKQHGGLDKQIPKVSILRQDSFGSSKTPFFALRAGCAGT